MKLIPLTQGKFAKVDDADFEWLSQWKWHLGRDGYARRTLYIGTLGGKRKYKALYMHRVILSPPDNLLTDHINSNKLDNQRSNLRLATKLQNNLNRPKQSNNKSGYKGVWWNRRSGKWEATLRLNGKKKFLGQRGTALEASKLYLKAAKEYFGDFASV